MPQDDTEKAAINADAAHLPASVTTEQPMKKIDWQKKATLAVLVSVGVTLLLTGATGSRMIKKPPTVKTGTSTSRHPAPAPAPAPAPPLPKAVVTPRASTILPPPPSRGPFAFIKSIPGASGLPPRRTSSRLRALFQSSPAPSTSTIPSSSLDFVANQHSTLLAKELPKPNLLGGGLVDPEDASIPEPAPEDKTNALLDAIKAFTLATSITLGSAGAGIYLLSRYLGANDIPTFMHQLRIQIMHPFATSVKKADFLPNSWKLKEKPRTPESIRSEKEDEEELRLIFERGWRDLIKQTGIQEGDNDNDDDGGQDMDDNNGEIVIKAKTA